MRKFVILSGLLIFALQATPAFAQSPALQIVSPKEGESILSNQIFVRFQVQNFKFVDFRRDKIAKPREGHLNIWLDNKTPTPQNAVKQISTEPYVLENVTTGNHTVTLELVHSDDSSFTPRIVQTVNFSSTAPQPTTAPTPPPSNSTLSPSAQIAIGVLIAIVAILGFAYLTLKPKK